MSQALLKIVSWLGLILTLVPSLLVFGEVIEFPMHKTLMSVGTVLWFFTRPFVLENEPTTEKA